MHRLESASPELAALLNALPEGEHRRAALVVARLAVTRTGLDDPGIRALLGVIASGTLGDSTVRAAVMRLTEELDHRQWAIQDRITSGAASEAEHLEAFRCARAASAVYFAADADERIAAMECVYEAMIALDDVAIVRSALAEIA